jgi:hypothetical protein
VHEPVEPEYDPEGHATQTEAPARCPGSAGNSGRQPGHSIGFDVSNTSQAYPRSAGALNAPTGCLHSARTRWLLRSCAPVEPEYAPVGHAAQAEAPASGQGRDQTAGEDQTASTLTSAFLSTSYDCRQVGACRRVGTLQNALLQSKDVLLLAHFQSNVRPSRGAATDTSTGWACPFCSPIVSRHARRWRQMQ